MTSERQAPERRTTVDLQCTPSEGCITRKKLYPVLNSQLE
jgi:hypothetical protein